VDPFPESFFEAGHRKRLGKKKGGRNNCRKQGSPEGLYLVGAKGGTKMNKTIYGFVLVALLALGLAASGAFAAAPMGQGGFMSFDSRDLIGAIVRNPEGNLVGLVSQVWIDTGGHAFAVLNHGSDEYYGDGGGYTPVPFEALRITEPMGGQVSAILNSDEMKLEAAPPFNPVAGNDRQYEADVYRYYGIQPYWTQSDECFTEGSINE
jgi:hypothetical protein